MQTSYISSAALRNAPRAEVLRLQNELTDRTLEISTGRHADVGRTLGAGAGRVVDQRVDRALFQALITSNTSATSRLEATQQALSDIEEVASETLAAMIASPEGNIGAQTLQRQGMAALDRLGDRLNASDGSAYLFAGINTAEAPFVRFEDGSQAAIEAAFLTRFGVAVGDPAAATIAPADMRDFLANEFDALFQDPQWGTTWSNAASQNIVSRIAPDERTETSTNANEQAMRDLAKGFAMLAALELPSLSQQTRDVIVEEGRQIVGEAIADVLQIKAELGFAEQAIHKAGERMALAEQILERTIVDSEGTDVAAAKVRVDLISAQIEMSYALTAQLSRLSILNYA